MSIEILPVLEEQKPVLGKLLEFYVYDFSEFAGFEVDEYGYYGYSHLDEYWTDQTRHPFFVKVDGKLAGFVLVFSLCDYIANENAHSIAEFFIMRKYRRNHVGDYAARYVFDLFPGEWEVKVLHSNKSAQLFWQKVIDGYTKGKYTLHEEVIENWNGYGYTFQAPETLL